LGPKVRVFWDEKMPKVGILGPNVIEKISFYRKNFSMKKCPTSSRHKTPYDPKRSEVSQM
jgi:hypothetical protein